jgi:2-alkenal reductase
MKHTHLFFLLSLLLVLGLACNAIGTVDEGSNEVVLTEELVAAAVATVEARLPEQPQSPTAPAGAVIGGDLQASLTHVYERANPGVVFIITSQEGFDLGSGSGFVFDDAGHIITNNHVVTDGDSFEVQFPSGERMRADLIGTDVDSDIAVLRVDELPEGVAPLPLGDFSALRVGQFVVAIGNPFEEQGSLSFGIISGLGRSITSARLAENGGTYSLPEVIQTDAPINPGNSGGPLLNLNGEVIGVNSAIRSDTGFNSGVGFAIPVAAVRRVVPAIIENGSYTYPYLGIGTSGGPIDLDRQEQLQLPVAYGVYVTSVTAGTPAEEAGVIAAPSAITPGGDLIIAIDGQEVREFNDLISYLTFQSEVGQTVELTIIRNGEEVIVPVTLGARP